VSSPPFAVIAAHTLKPSQNQYTELILRTLGQNAAATEHRHGRDRTDEELGLAIVRNFLHQTGIAENDVALDDGSGLSRNDFDFRKHHRAIADVHVEAQVLCAVSRRALPIAGTDGTLSTRMRGTPAERTCARRRIAEFRRFLSGYVTTAAGEHLVFSMMLNYPDIPRWPRDQRRLRSSCHQRRS
jgi:D-alanyl-D-alanine carboxypeptidase/D-alanyl-D-alanine-endopeptidase (penicillin-binding protein 4)